MGSNCVYLVNVSLTQPAVVTLFQVLSLTCASVCNKCARFHQCGMAKSIAVRLCTESFPLPHVFVRVDAHKYPLQAPYKGPFKVLERHVKYFKLDLGNRDDTVSIDRLKPAFMDEPLQDAPVVRDGARSVQTREPRSEAVKPHPIVSNTEPETNLVVTASGRLVKLPTRYRH